MKKNFLILVTLFFFKFLYAQNGVFKTGVHIGLPIANASTTSKLNIGVDIAYLWKISDKFNFGLTTGYTSYSSKKIKNYNPFFGEIEFKPVAAGYIPLAMSGQYSLSDNMFLGADFGYAIYNDATNGSSGIIYHPKLGFQTKKTETYIGYKAISLNNFTFSSINIGFNFKF